MRKLLLGLIGLLFAVPTVAATLPAGYTELEYIESERGAYIDTGISYGKFVHDIQFTIDGQRNLLGCGASDSQFWEATAADRFLFSSASNGYILGNPANRNIVEFSINTTEASLTVGNNTKTHTHSSTGNRTYLLFALNGSTTYSALAKLYSLKVYNDSDVLIQDLVPVKRLSDGVVGMYDTVSENFFTNAGTGEFIAGPEVPVFAGGGGVVDLGTLSWTKFAGDSGLWDFAATITDLKGQEGTGPDASRLEGIYVDSDTYMLSAQYAAYAGNNALENNHYIKAGLSGNAQLHIRNDNFSDATAFKQSLSGVYLYYQRATDETWTAPNQIKIATTAYNTARFSPVVTELNNTIATIRSVVTNTINQTKAIADLQATKQTRPNETCPAGKKCLLVEDNDGQPHWYEIIENAYGLPSGYTQVDYVTNIAQTMIDTGVKFDFSKNYEIELKARGVTDSWYLFQARGGSGLPISGISGSQSGNLITLNFKGENVSASQITRVDGNIYYVKGTINNGNLTLYVKDETAGTEETVTGTYTVTTGQSANIGLFGNLARNYVGINSNVYFARIKEDGNYIMDYVPAKQGTTAGFYDKVSGTFKTATSLSAGPEI